MADLMIKPDDPFTPSWRLIGGYWQWGRKGPESPDWYDTNTSNFAHGPTGPPEFDDADPNSGAISEWDTSYADDGAWSDLEKTANDPCPAGYRVPTYSQWEGVVVNNTQRVVGTWSSSYTDYSSARFFGDDLMLPATGYRSSWDAQLYARELGHYWSSSASFTVDAYYLTLGCNHAYTDYYYRREAYPVRCVAE